MPPSWSRRGLLTAVGLLAVLGAGAAPAAAGNPAAGSTSAGSTSAELTSTVGSSSETAPGPVVLIGTAGVRWSDVGAATPALAGLAPQFALANSAVRTVRPVTCPTDGWLSVSAGTRAADLVQPDGGCRTLADPGPDGVVPHWADYVAAATQDEYEAVPGLLGDRLSAAGVRVRALGPGAAVATATSAGSTVGRWSPLPADPAALRTQVAEALTDGDGLVVVDAGAVRDGGATLAQVDERVAAALAGVHDATGTDPTVLISSLADRDGTPALQLTAVRGPGAGPTLATSASTRQPGIVTVTDVPATLAHTLGLDATSFIGAPMTSTATAPADRVAALVDTARHASVARPLVPAFYLGLVLLNVALYAAVALGLARAPGARAAGEPQRRRTLAVTRAVALGVGAVPVGLLLANLVPWWRAPAPGLALAASAAAIDVALVAVALLGPWRRAVLGPAGVLAAVTALVIVVDVLRGGGLQLSAVIGAPTLAAGRFYGFNNTAFALATAATLFAVTALVDPWVRAGRRGVAAVVVAVVGLGLTLVDGASALGADFGGPPALIPGFTVLALLAAGATITWRRVVGVLGAAVVVTGAFAVVDWLRPADQRTHLGQLVQTALDGGLWVVVGRKVSANLHIIANNRPLTVLTLAGVAFVVAALVRPVRAVVLSPDGGRYGWLSHGTALGALATAAPMLAPCLVATATALLIGFAVNDSGIAIPAIGVAVTVPLVIATCASWLAGLTGPAEPGSAPGPAGAGPADATRADAGPAAEVGA